MLNEKIINHVTESKTTLVVFDFDGTLYDKAGLPFRLVCSDFCHCGLLGAERTIRKHLAGRYFGNEQDYYQELFWQISHKHYRFRTVARVSHWYHHRYMANMVRILSRRYSMFPWVEATVKELRSRGIRIAILSDYGYLPERLRAIGFDPSWADCIADAPSLGGLKPAKQVFEKVLQQMGTAPCQALMVGDRDDTDGEGARRVGMPYINVKAGIQ